MQAGNQGIQDTAINIHGNNMLKLEQFFVVSGTLLLLSMDV